MYQFPLRPPPQPHSFTADCPRWHFCFHWCVDLRWRVVSFYSYSVPWESCVQWLLYSLGIPHLSHLMIKPTKWHVRLAKTQIRLGIRPVWSESSLCAQWVTNGPSFLHADSEDSDQTGRMPRLIWVFAGRTGHIAGIVMLWLIYVITEPGHSISYKTAWAPSEDSDQPEQ